MSRVLPQVVLAVIVFLTVIGQRVKANSDTVVASIPPPPEELILTFPNDIPSSFDRANLDFFGSINSNGYSALTTFTWRFNWTLPSGEVRYSNPFTYPLFPGRDTHVDAGTTIGGCPASVSLEFTTESPLGATVNGTFEHTCTIPEPGFTALIGFSGLFMLRRIGRKKIVEKQMLIIL